MLDLETIPIFPGLWITPGIIPILHSKGFIIPGQLGPIILVWDYDLKASFTLIISCYGIPSVIVTTKSN